MTKTKKQEEVFNAIKSLSAKNNRPPTLREVQEYLGYKTTSSVQRHTDALKKKGFLTSMKHQSRSLQIKKKVSKKSSIPLIGLVACGEPILATQNIEAYIPYEVKGDPSEYFFLRASGNSMNKAGIDDGDLALIKSQNSAQLGEKVLALIGDDATIKILAEGNGYIVLEPHSTNPAHKPIYIYDELEIQGVVKGVIKNR